MTRRGKFLAMLSIPLLVAATSPLGLKGVAGGLWEVSASASGKDAVQRCIRDPLALAQWESRDKARCTRLILDDKPGRVRVQYTCASGDFGRSDMEVITPRSVRIATQGIHDGFPFDQTYHARRLGGC